MHSFAFRWFSAAALVFCSLVFFPNSGIKVGGSCILCMEKILTVHILCDIFLLYTVLCRIGKLNVLFPVLRIHRIHMFLGLLNPDPLVRGMDPDADSYPDPHQHVMDPQHCKFFHLKNTNNKRKKKNICLALISDVNESKKTKQLIGFSKPRKKIC
jgi:hypothetical protein